MEMVCLADAILFMARKPRCGKGYPGYTSMWQGTPQQQPSKKPRPTSSDETGSLIPPVFSFENGKYFTPAGLNTSLGFLLSDICSPGENSISCHSFRAGIPTALSFFPDLVSSDDVKGWGHWSSDCYEKYSRLKHHQKQSIFEKIAAAIRSLADS